MHNNIIIMSSMQCMVFDSETINRCYIINIILILYCYIIIHTLSDIDEFN